jgi:Skp family chaperone for outer membrane proteins
MNQDYTPGQGCQCNEPDHGAINAERAESRGLRKAWVELDDKRQDLEKQLSTITKQRDKLAATLREEVAAHAKTITDLQDMEEQRDIWKAKAERWREAAEESFQTRAWKQLIEEEKHRMRSRMEYMVGEDWGSKLSKSK